jgi:hypothetical protein
MKSLLALLAMAASANAQSPVVIYQQPSQAAIVSPLTSSTAQSNQALLGQIHQTISQRYFEHQILTLSPPSAPPILFNSTPRVIKAR